MTRETAAHCEGFTERYEADCAAFNLTILIRPGTDLDDTFTAFDPECCEYVRISGWLWTLERVEN